MRCFIGLLLLTALGCKADVPHVSTDSIEAIDVNIYKSDVIGVKDDFTVTIPKRDWENILSFVLPHQVTSIGPNQSDELQVGTVVIKYQDKESLSIKVFFAGKNPCMVTLDGKHYYYAKNNPDAPDGPIDLIRKVIDIRKSSEKKEKRKRVE